MSIERDLCKKQNPAGHFTSGGWLNLTRRYFTPLGQRMRDANISWSGKSTRLPGALTRPFCMYGGRWAIATSSRTKAYIFLREL
jgi:hypothetical protein